MSALTAAPVHAFPLVLRNMPSLATHCYEVNDVRKIVFPHAAHGGRESALHRQDHADATSLSAIGHQRHGNDGTRYIINLRVLLHDIESARSLKAKAEMRALYAWLSQNVASALSSAFKGCDPDCADEAQAKIALETRITSRHAWETTDVAVCVGDDHLTGRQTLSFVGTAGLREFDHPGLRHEGRVWFGDYVIAPGFRGTGDGRAMYFIVNAGAAEHLDELPHEASGKVRLFTEPHNDALYERLGSERGNDHAIPNMDNSSAAQHPFVTVRIRYVNPQTCLDMLTRMRVNRLRKRPELA